MDKDSLKAIELVVARAISLAGQPPTDVERACWLAVHEYCHGFMPSEYDIRETDEDFYLEVLAKVRVTVQIDF